MTKGGKWFLRERIRPRKLLHLLIKVFPEGKIIDFAEHLIAEQILQAK